MNDVLAQLRAELSGVCENESGPSLGSGTSTPGLRPPSNDSRTSSRATTPWMHEVGFSRFDAQKYQSCGVGRVRPQLIRHVDNDLREFAEKDETLQRVVETFARKLMRTGEATNTALSILTDMMWCVLAVMYFAAQNNQIPSLHLSAGKDALEEAHKKLECQLQHCRKEYLSELTAMRDRHRHFTPEMEATLLKCANIEPTYFFATKRTTMGALGGAAVGGTSGAVVGLGTG